MLARIAGIIDRVTARTGVVKLGGLTFLNSWNVRVSVTVWRRVSLQEFSY